MSPKDAGLRARMRDLGRLVRADPPLEADPTLVEQEVADREADRDLRRWLPKVIVGMAVGQLIVTNVGYLVFYAWIGHDFQQPPETVGWWIWGTIAQVFGGVFIIVRYVFPNRDKSPSGPPAPPPPTPP